MIDWRRTTATRLNAIWIATVTSATRPIRRQSGCATASGGGGGGGHDHGWDDRSHSRGGRGGYGRVCGTGTDCDSGSVRGIATVVHCSGRCRGGDCTGEGNPRDVGRGRSLRGHGRGRTRRSSSLCPGMAGVVRRGSRTGAVDRTSREGGGEGVADRRGS